MSVQVDAKFLEIPRCTMVGVKGLRCKASATRKSGFKFCSAHRIKEEINLDFIPRDPVICKPYELGAVDFRRENGEVDCAQAEDADDVDAEEDISDLFRVLLPQKSPKKSAWSLSARK